MIVPLTSNLNSFPAVAVLLLLAIIGVLLIAHGVRSIRFVNLTAPVLLGAVATSSLLAFAITFSNTLQSDEGTWHGWGTRAADFLTGASSQSVQYVEGKDGYIWIVGALYAIAGPAPLVPILLNIILHALLILTVSRITEIVAAQAPGVTERVAKRAIMASAYAVALSPSVFLWVPRMFREIVGAFLISIAVLLVIKFATDHRSRYLFGALIALAVLTSVRSTVGFAVAVALGIAGVLLWGIGTRYYSIRLVALLPPLGLAGVALWNTANDLFGLSPEEVSARNRDLAISASSGFSGGEALSSSSGYMDILTTNLPRVLFGPFVWEYRFTTVMMLAALEGLIWIATVYFASQAHPLAALRSQRRAPSPGQDISSAVVVILVVTGILLVILSLSVSNYGLLARMRLMPFIVLLPLASVGLGMRLSKPPANGVSRRRSEAVSLAGKESASDGQ